MEVKVKTKDFLVDATIEMIDGVMLVLPVADLDLKPKKWKPEPMESFYFPAWRGAKNGFFSWSAVFQNKDEIDDDSDVCKGWVFKTKKECDNFCKKLNEKINEVEL